MARSVFAYLVWGRPIEIGNVCMKYSPSGRSHHMLEKGLDFHLYLSNQSHNATQYDLKFFRHHTEGAESSTETKGHKTYSGRSYNNRDSHNTLEHWFALACIGLHWFALVGIGLHWAIWWCHRTTRNLFEKSDVPCPAIGHPLFITYY
jgi:hypothetical protein